MVWLVKESVAADVTGWGGDGEGESVGAVVLLLLTNL